MLSILCSTLWGQAGGFSVGVFVGGMMMSGKHNYKREDVKPDKLKAWYLNDYLENRKYPLIVREKARVAQVLIDEFTKLKGAATPAAIDIQAQILKANLVAKIITNEGLRYFTDPNFKNPGVKISPSDSLAATIVAYDKPYDDVIGTLGSQEDRDLTYPGAQGIFLAADTDPFLMSARKSRLSELNSAAALGGPAFRSAVAPELTAPGPNSAFNTAQLADFDNAVRLYTATFPPGVLAPKPGDANYQLLTALSTAGKNLVAAKLSDGDIFTPGFLKFGSVK